MNKWHQELAKRSACLSISSPDSDMKVIFCQQRPRYGDHIIHHLNQGPFEDEQGPYDTRTINTNQNFPGPTEIYPCPTTKHTSTFTTHCSSLVWSFIRYCNTRKERQIFFWNSHISEDYFRQYLLQIWENHNIILYYGTNRPYLWNLSMTGGTTEYFILKL